ncbi:ORF MSV152 putative core protein P4a homolog (vaccinia A10L), similar to SW:P33817 [Melanoplus sanguinipes entomopoxvirus]|uniref:ORF MSV152 putative core protein P4a homolog (Vaccinia A10L), similar to SW:P33817 n=1 Tax=Melanoplus sanguinipes entomopoxvirus TaxID=83191 RepID=Q9YVU0_MSEPV|nr:ORF MSV152 putative core protein P4a homolog (vaccinia A10L), similar to SW:P33817 [Melanoplus sanguinipes entomopoxvirus]AAC97675.1 ORF MSV152 putative core protein P4a homolog (vaccinia A10L), similar to SW:P33817 [Melanoplus sanguinipes entomopoxvirus 'O']
MKDKNNHINYLLDNVLNYIDFYDTLSKNNEITINGKQYKLDEILSKTYMHPLDTIKIQNTNVIFKNEIYNQFMINLFMHYNNPAMNFTHNLQNIINNKTEILPDELSFFNYNTANYLRYRFMYDDNSSGLRGGMLIDKTEDGFISYNDESASYIVKKMENYISIINEDKYDFYVTYHAFIDYFLENDKLSYGDIIDEKSKNDKMYNKDEDYKKYLNEHTVSNDESKKIRKKIKYYLKFFDTILHKDIISFYEYIPLTKILDYIDKDTDIKLILDILITKAEPLLNENNSTEIIAYLFNKKQSLRLYENKKYYNNNNNALSKFVSNKLLDIQRRIINIMEINSDNNPTEILITFNSKYQSLIINNIYNAFIFFTNYINNYLIVYEFNLDSPNVKKFIKKFNDLCDGIFDVLTLDEPLVDDHRIDQFFSRSFGKRDFISERSNEQLNQMIINLYKVFNEINNKLKNIVEETKKFVNAIKIEDINYYNYNKDNNKNEKKIKYAINVLLLSIYVNIIKGQLDYDKLIKYLNYDPETLQKDLFSNNQNNEFNIILKNNIFKNLNFIESPDLNKEFENDHYIFDSKLNDNKDKNNKYDEIINSINENSKKLFYDCLSTDYSSLFKITPHLEIKDEVYKTLINNATSEFVKSGKINILNAFELKDNIYNKIPLVLNPVINIKKEVNNLHEKIFKGDYEDKYKNISINNYKSFISMLPTYYYTLLYNNPTILKVTHNQQTKIVNDNKIFHINSSPNINFFNPFQNSNDADLIMIENENKNNLDKLDSIIYSNFWFGIPYNDFDKLTILQKSFILRSCFTIVKSELNNTIIHTTYDNALDKGMNIDFICIIPYPYSATETMHSIVMKVVNSLNITDSMFFQYNRNDYISNIGLDQEGNKIFINKVLELSSLKDLVITYILLRESNSGNADLKLSPDQEATFIVNIMRLLNYNVTVTTNKKNTSNAIYIRVRKDRITVDNFKRILRKNYNISNQKILTAIGNKMAPLLSYINRKNLNKNIEYAGMENNLQSEDFIYPIIEYNNPINILDNVDLSFMNTNSLFELLNTDIFEPETRLFKSKVIAAMSSNSNDNIVDVIVEHLPQSSTYKKSICSNIYEIIAGNNENPLNEIIQNFITPDCDEESINIDNNTLLKKIINKNKIIASVDTDITANIFKNNLIKIMETITNRYACQLRAPIHYINTLDKLKNILSSENINIEGEFKDNISGIISSLYNNTLLIIQYIIIINTILELSRAYKRVNKDINGTIINEDLINEVKCVFNDIFSKYFNNIENLRNNPIFNSFLGNNNRNDVLHEY